MDCPNCSAPIDEGIRICPTCQAYIEVRVGRLSGLAVTSLVLAILGIAISIVPAVTGCITGVLAYFFIVRSEGRLDGLPFAIAGILLSAAGVAWHVWLLFFA